jgi:phosphoribosylformimino-5-aminoimidazole carboxamide ribotide isomerase
MLIIPAIDLKDGQCVRLKQGLMDERNGLLQLSRRTGSPLAGRGRATPACGRSGRRFCRQAEEREGDQGDRAAVGDEIPVQLGGGIRDLDTIERCLDDGVSYVIIGTAAVKNPGFLHDACGAFPGPHHRWSRRQGWQGSG